MDGYITHFDAPENVYVSKTGWKLLELPRRISCKGDFQCEFIMSPLENLVGNK